MIRNNNNTYHRTPNNPQCYNSYNIIHRRKSRHAHIIIVGQY